LFGRGLNKEPSVDDFGSHNEVIHPEMLNELAAQFVAYNYDPKQLLQWICLSDAYNLSHVAPKDAADPKFDAYFAHMALKALSPEELYESLQTATKFDETSTVAGRRNLKEEWTSKLVRTFGDDEGNEVTFNGTMIQALMMMNGREMNSQVGKADASSVVRKAILRHMRNGGFNHDAILDELFLTTLGRHPTQTETEKLKATMRGGIVTESKPVTKTAKSAPQKPAKGKPGQKPKKPAAKSPPAVTGFGPANDALAYYQDVFWALLNTAEFMLNH
jgi:hypothetical protein